MSCLETTIAIDSRTLGSLESTAPCLFLVFESSRPRAAPIRYALSGVPAVEFGRGRERALESVGTEGSRLLSIRVPDPTVSASHAELRRTGGGWQLTDTGSTNGTFVNGERCSARLLADGDLLEIGQTLFVFRRALPITSGTAANDPPERAIPGMATLNPSLEQQFERIRAIAKGSISVSIFGESGTGKELLASAIHRLSGRTGSFVAFNCGSVPHNLIASELFGYRRGAFSGADEDRLGLIRSADGGTVFLDEIGDLALESQVALLRVLQEREVLPLGATRPVKVDVRFLCATSQDLPARVAAGRFRPDLYARLAAFTCQLPPLAERREDMGLIVATLLRRHAGDQSREVTITIDAARAMWSYGWPGNVRELDNCMAAAVLLAAGRPIGLADLPPEIQSTARRDRTPSTGPRERPLTVTQVEQRERVVALLGTHKGNVSAVARELGKERVQVHRWLRRFEIDPSAFRR